MSQGGGDNHFLSAKERDLRPLLTAGVDALELDAKQAWQLEVFLEQAWLSGTRNGHTKLLNQALRLREDPESLEPEKSRIEPAQLDGIKAEFKTMMESSAEVLGLMPADTLVLWEYLSQAWAAGARAFEDEILAKLIESENDSDLSGEVLAWLDEREPPDR